MMQAVIEINGTVVNTFIIGLVLVYLRDKTGI